MNSLDAKALNKKKNEDYDKFLSITNRKPAIFRDIIIENECELEFFFCFGVFLLLLMAPFSPYSMFKHLTHSHFFTIAATDDPMEPNKRCIKAKTGFLKDPVKIDEQKAAAEGAMLGPGAGVWDWGSHVFLLYFLMRYFVSFAGAKPKNKLCKETLDVQLWAAGQIEATPYGTFSRIMGKDKSKSGKLSGAGTAGPTGGAEKAKSATMRSSVVFDHFNYPTSKASIDSEMPRGKRIQPILIYADPKKVFNDRVPR